MHAAAPQLREEVFSHVPPRTAPAQQPQQAADRPWEEDPQLTGKERLWAILGALKATLLICGVYLLGLLALLALLFTLWH